MRLAPASHPCGFELELAVLLDELGIGSSAWTPYRFRCELGYEAGDDLPAPRLAMGAIKAFVEENVADALDLERLAREAHLSKYHFARTFRDYEGITPWAYVQRVRVRRAKELLDAGATLAEAALGAGFCDQSHFTNTFKRIEGVTPGQYRQNRKDLQEEGEADG